MIARIIRRFAQRLIERALARPYFHVFGRDGSLYMARYWLVKPHWWTLGCGARIHCITRPDADRHLHDHPWPYVSVILRGGYFELQPIFRRFPGAYDEEPTTASWRGEGSVLFRSARSRHRLDLPREWRAPSHTHGLPNHRQAWSLFIFGPKVQKWGFYTAAGKIAWDKYLPSEEAAYQRDEHAKHGLRDE